MAMKKLLLTGVAALLLGVAHARLAQAATIELPNGMLGYWCFSHATTDDDPDQEASVLEQANNFDACGNHGGIHLRKGRSYQLGRFDWRANCKINAIEVVSNDPKTYRVYSYCRANGEMFVGDPTRGAKVFELWRSKAGLRMRDKE
jgi:hypothetical protein